MLFLGDTREAKHLVFAQLLGVSNHLRHQVVGIHNGSFAALHLAVWQLYHAVREMYEFLSEGETKPIEKDRENLKMVLLLVAHYIYHLIDGVVLKTQLSRTDILRHIYRGAIASEQQFLIEPIGREVSPYRIVVAAVEFTGCQTFLNLRLAL